MEQNTINQRLKFLVDKLNMSSRAFSELIGESPTNTHNYIGSRQAEPRAGYLTKVLSHFSDINPSWLMTGKGEPFLDEETRLGVITKRDFNQASNIQKVKGNKNNVQTNNGDHATITNNVKLDNCQRDLEASRKEIALLTSQLADKERTIQILLKQVS